MSAMHLMSDEARQCTLCFTLHTLRVKCKITFLTAIEKDGLWLMTRRIAAEYTRTRNRFGDQRKLSISRNQRRRCRQYSLRRHR